MGYGNCGYDSEGRPIGYLVRAECDYPGCKAIIERGLDFACGNEHGTKANTTGGIECCDQYFCNDHMSVVQLVTGDAVSVCAACEQALEAAGDIDLEDDDEGVGEPPVTQKPRPNLTSWGEPYTLENPITGATYPGRARCGIGYVEVAQNDADGNRVDRLTTWSIFDTDNAFTFGIAFSAPEAQRFADELIDRFADDLVEGRRVLVEAIDRDELIKAAGEIGQRHGVVAIGVAATWVAQGGQWIEENEGAPS